MHRRLQAVSRWTVLVAVAASPWLFGSVEPWAFLAVCMAVGVGTAAWLGSVCVDPSTALRAPVLTACMIGLVVIVCVQMLPLPRSLVASLSPFAAGAHERGTGLLDGPGADALPPAARDRPADRAVLSVSPAATRRSLCLLAAYAGTLLVAANAFRNWRQVRRAALVLTGSAFLVALVGILQRLSGTERIYWFHVPRFAGSTFGTFTNANHCAAYLNMALGLGVGLLLAIPASARAGRGAGLRRALVRLSTRGGSRSVFLAFAVVTMATAVCLSWSRGAMISLFLAALAIGACAIGAGHARRAAPWMGAGTLLAGAGVFWLGWQPVAANLGSLGAVLADPMANERAVATHDTLKLFTLAPAFGVGFGAFEHAFPVCQGPAIQAGRWLHAHNDYAQLLAEGGIIGSALAAAAVVAFGTVLARGFHSAGRPLRSFVVGASIGLAAIALHSGIDFSLHKPANAFLLALMCGLCLAAVHTGRPVPSGPGPAGRTRRALVRLAALGGIAVLAALGAVAAGDMLDDLAFARFRSMARLAGAPVAPAVRSRAVAAAAEEMALLTASGADNSDALWTMAATSREWVGADDLDPILRLRIADQAVGVAALSALEAPSNYRVWLCLARTQAAVGRWAAARASLETAGAFAPRGMEVALEVHRP